MSSVETTFTTTFTDSAKSSCATYSSAQSSVSLALVTAAAGSQNLRKEATTTNTSTAPEPQKFAIADGFLETAETCIAASTSNHSNLESFLLTIASTPCERPCDRTD